MMSLKAAIFKSKTNHAVKNINSSNLTRAEVQEILVVHNRISDNYLVTENSRFVEPMSLEDIELKYGVSGWEVGK